jgi:hypothetical protein
VGQRELEVLDEELLDVRSADVVGLLELNDLEDLGSVSKMEEDIGLERLYLNGSETRSVTGGHVLVQRIDGGDAGHLTVLLVHVVGTGARVVPDPDTEVLDLLGLLLVDLAPVSLPSSMSIVCLHAPGLRRRSHRWPS